MKPVRYLALLLSCALLLLMTPADDIAQAHNRSLNVSEFRYQMPIGLLGSRLGSRLVVEAVRSHALMSNPIKVMVVNMTPLREGVVLDSSGIRNLRDGVRYQLEGYETGEFSGYPGWVNPNAQQPFQYRPGFVVTRVLLESKE